MAAGEHDPSRRALLGAAVGIPFLPHHPELGSGSSSPPLERATRWAPDQVRGDGDGVQGDGAWASALEAFRSAKAEVERIEAATAGYSAEEEEALLPAHEAACDAMEAALGRVVLAEAPDFAAFAVKLGLFFDHGLEPDSVEEEVLAAMRGDARRLAGL